MGSSAVSYEDSQAMHEDIIIPVYELALLMLTCIVVGYCAGQFVEKWKRLK